MSFETLRGHSAQTLCKCLGMEVKESLNPLLLECSDNFNRNKVILGRNNLLTSGMEMVRNDEFLRRNLRG